MTVLQLIKIVCLLGAAVMLGHMFLAEVKKARKDQKPWYAPYLTLPGLLILIVILLPVILRLFRQ